MDRSRKFLECNDLSSCSYRRASIQFGLLRSWKGTLLSVKAIPQFQIPIKPDSLFMIKIMILMKRQLLWMTRMSCSNVLLECLAQMSEWEPQNSIDWTLSEWRKIRRNFVWSVKTDLRVRNDAMIRHVFMSSEKLSPCFYSCRSISKLVFERFQQQPKLRFEKVACTCSYVESGARILMRYLASRWWVAPKD